MYTQKLMNNRENVGFSWCKTSRQSRPHLTCSKSKAFSAVTFPASFFSLYTQMVLCISMAVMNALGRGGWEARLGVEVGGR